jgi:hypothetical protein
LTSTYPDVLGQVLDIVSEYFSAMLSKKSKIEHPSRLGKRNKSRLGPPVPNDNITTQAGNYVPSRFGWLAENVLQAMFV